MMEREFMPPGELRDKAWTARMIKLIIFNMFQAKKW
jgi:hypothetical protein